MADFTSETQVRRDAHTPAVEHDSGKDERRFRFNRAIAVEKAALDRALPRACTFILAAILYFMNSQAKRAWPSYQKIAELTGYSEDVIEKSIRELKRAGYLFTERRSPITGGRALVHYGLRSIHPRDIDQMIATAVYALRRGTANKTHPAENSGVRSKLTPPNTTGSNTDSANFDASDPAKFHRQKPYIEEPSDSRFVDARGCDRETYVFTDAEFEELHALYNGWGQKPGSSWVNEVDRAACDLMIAGEINACRSRNAGVDEGRLRSAALIALNTLRSTKPKGSNGGSSMLRLFRSVIDSELARAPRAAAAAPSRLQRPGPVSTAELARAAFASRES